MLTLHILLLSFPMGNSQVDNGKKRPCLKHSTIMKKVGFWPYVLKRQKAHLQTYLILPRFTLLRFSGAVFFTN